MGLSIILKEIFFFGWALALGLLCFCLHMGSYHGTATRRTTLAFHKESNNYLLDLVKESNSCCSYSNGIFFLSPYSKWSLAKFINSCTPLTYSISDLLRICIQHLFIFRFSQTISNYSFSERQDMDMRHQHAIWLLHYGCKVNFRKAIQI